MNPRQGPGNKARISARRERVFQLRLEGWTTPAIAREVGVSETMVRKDIDAEHKKLVVPLAEEDRKRQIARLELLLEETMKVLREGAPVTQHGKVVVDKETGRPMQDKELILKAVDRAAKLSDQLAKLTGSYSSEKSEVQVTHVSELDTEIQKLVDAMNDQAAKTKEAVARKRNRSHESASDVVAEDSVVNTGEASIEQ